MSSAVISDSRSEQRRVIDDAILEVVSELRESIPMASETERTLKLANTVRELTEARRAL